jgi:plasmid stabilization system protein ParE
MATVPEIIPVTDLRQDAAAVLRRVQAAQQPLVITQRGRAGGTRTAVTAVPRARRARDCSRHGVRPGRGVGRGRHPPNGRAPVRVRFTPTGRAQFLAALAYIRRENPPAAIRFRQRAEQALRRLEQFPESGRVVPEFPDLPYREVIVAPYRFFYRIEEATVWVVAVWHGAQPPEEPQV